VVTPPPAAHTAPGPEPSQPEEKDKPLAKVIPLGLFDPLADPWKRQ
jgi:putative transposase